MGISKTYLDSSYLLAIIQEEGMGREVEHMLYNLRENSFDVFIPHAVLGEVCGVIFRNFESDQDRLAKMEKLVNVISSNKIKWENMKPLGMEAFSLMVTLRDKDPLLDATDVMILSHVLSDPDSKFFFTTDSKLLGSTVAADLEKELYCNGKRNESLKIRDRF